MKNIDISGMSILDKKHFLYIINNNYILFYIKLDNNDIKKSYRAKALKNKKAN